MIHILAAIQCEARPLIAHFGLKGSPDPGPFRLYEGDGMRLVISGIGKVAAAAACSHLASRAGATASDAWLNIGTAGHGAHPIGTGILAHKVTDAGSGMSWYPPRVFPTALTTAPVVTVERPELAYPHGAAYEMEAAGFYATATRYATSELVHCCKVVSDNHTRTVDQVTPGLATALMEENLAHIEALVEQLADLSNHLADISADPPLLRDLLARWRFTAYERNQLRQLLRRWQLLSPQDDAAPPDLMACRSGKEALARLQRLVDSRAARAAMPT